MPRAKRHLPTFRIKAGLAVGLVGLADLLFFRHPVGWTLGAFAIACTAAVALASPAVRRNRTARIWLGLAALAGLAMLDTPSLLGAGLFWLALSISTLTVRSADLSDPGAWIRRLAWHPLVASIGPLLDLRRLKVRWTGGWRSRFTALLVLLAAPVLGGLIFLSLFAAANPLISQVLGQIEAPRLDVWMTLRIVFWGFVLVIVWSFLRPRHWRSRLRPSATARAFRLPVPSSGALILSLVVFNAVFALENGLDLAFLWSGAALPGGMTLAEYAHRGAYPLIFTALLAGAFVLVALRPGSETSRKPLVVWLLVAWVAQNVFLVASSMLRTVDYIEAYSLTRLRIAALVWMALVGLGLVLICWRMLKARSANWLLAANGLAVLVVLAAVTVVDTGAVAAAWNVRHAKEVSGRGAGLDLAYLHALGPSALPSLYWLQLHAPDPTLRRTAACMRADIRLHVEDDQADWRGWTWRKARRLAQSGPKTTPC